jgi:diadenosine tetraphosphate (Ap4A) HIT family hydrolase
VVVRNVALSSDERSSALPAYVDWPLFPFEGELRVKAPMQLDADRMRSGEPGGPPCGSCPKDDDAFIWVDDHWRVFAGSEPPSVPVLVFLETRAHVDLDGLDAERAAELGPMIVRLDRAIRAVGKVGRVHVHRWGDGAEHFHLWFYARPVGSIHLAGFGMPLWEPILPPISETDWRANQVTVARALAQDGGRSIVG